MSDPLAPIFNDLNAWSVFADFLREFGDDDRLDAPTVMERIMPIFNAYQDATRTRRLDIPLGSSNSKFVAQHFVFCTGLSKRGSFGYRIMRVRQPEQLLDVIDVDRLLDGGELFRSSSWEKRAAQLQSAARNVEQHLQMTLQKSFRFIKDKLKHSARSVDDLHFLNDGADNFQDFASAREKIADEMLTALEDLLNGNRRKGLHVRVVLSEALKNFDDKRNDGDTKILGAVKAALNPHVLEILSRNHSTLNVSHYQWLTRDKNKKTPPFRQALADACPAVMLVNNYQDIVAHVERGMFTVDTAIQTIFACRGMEDGIAFYAGLNEALLGRENAAWLANTARHIHAWRQKRLNLDTRADWDRLSIQVAASREYARALGTHPEHVFSELASEIEKDPNFIPADKNARHRHIEDIEILRSRIVTFGLAKKLILEAKTRGFALPVKDALYIASGTELVHRNQIAKMPRKVVEFLAGDDLQSENGRRLAAFHKNNNLQSAGGRKLVDLILSGTSIRSMRDHARAYVTNHGARDAFLRLRKVTNRLFENPKDYIWESVPIVDMPEEGYRMVPQTSHTDLQKIDFLEGTELWRQSAQAIVDGTHFLAMMRGGAIDAIAIIAEPKNEQDSWRVREVVSTHTGRSRNYLLPIAEAALCKPKFLDAVNLPKIRQRRAELNSTISDRATGPEMLGLNNFGDVEELIILKQHWPCAQPFEIDDLGCMSNPDIDKITRLTLDLIAPHYRHKIDARNLPGRPQPEIG